MDLIVLCKAENYTLYKARLFFNFHNNILVNRQIMASLFRQNEIQLVMNKSPLVLNKH